MDSKHAKIKILFRNQFKLSDQFIFQRFNWIIGLHFL